METEISEKPRRRRGIYLLPNLFTTAALFAGFYAIVAAMKGHFEEACHAIFIAMILDSLDGRVARLTNTETAFGVQYDSLSDMISFGAAPALVVYCWSLMDMGKIGWLAPFLFAATVALRLARFNTQAASADKRYFQGLPCTAAAPVLASLVWLSLEFHLSPQVMAYVMIPMLVALGLLMVSNIRYHSFKKKLDFKGKVPFVGVLVVVLIFMTISLHPPTVLFLAFFGYMISGPILTLWSLRQKRIARKAHSHHV